MNTIMLILAAPCVIVAVFAACRRDAPTAAAGVTGALLFAHPRRPHRRGRAPRRPAESLRACPRFDTNEHRVTARKSAWL